MNEPLSPQIEAMQRALQAAEAAAEKRRLAKLAASEMAFDAPGLDLDEDLAVIMATAVGSLPTDEPMEDHFFLSEGDDLGAILEQLDAEIPDLTDREHHGDLVVMRPDAAAKAWYELAAEEALPAALREIKGPIDVKMMLQALLVEIGDVKRTNAIIMDQLARLEEKVDRTNRSLKDKRLP
ncbi:MAG: hypothetical protein ACK46X_02890 [Candidatus Sericytochromatia bacterium]